ncbi:peroxiredoxin [Streptomyces montanisoli]|uniref:Alkyl hydroperoxide reductase E n=1 Tax=Streptomyces montanisoli TaxID=2798581 RepID=A0A940M8T3_9ACTN|nr:peroxiredoxin [Streptomyces montanisoli]MBP0458369.1 peroxiredoxin [Streptomyces montanisoli]
MAVEAGAQAPDFSLQDQHGQTVRLSDFRGQGGRHVVLVFYPYAFSTTCTGELQELRDRADAFADAGAQLLACSADSVHALRAYAEQERIAFPLLADHWPHGAVARAYGVLDEERGRAVRGTFVIDTSGTVRWSVVNPVHRARDSDDYVRALSRL